MIVARSVILDCERRDEAAVSAACSIPHRLESQRAPGRPQPLYPPYSAPAGAGGIPSRVENFEPWQGNICATYREKEVGKESHALTCPAWHASHLDSTCRIVSRSTSMVLALVLVLVLELVLVLVLAFNVGHFGGVSVREDNE